MTITRIDLQGTCEPMEFKSKEAYKGKYNMAKHKIDELAKEQT